MLLEVLKSKIHRVTVTQADLNYIGSITDIVIIIAYAMMDAEEARRFKPSVIFPDTQTNRLIQK